jgi:class 3 adenylate cyclase/DNA-binding CsgD family transcriptional regulator
VSELASGVVTLLFTDLVASTELLARLGDDAADEVRRTYYDLLRHAVAETDGQEVKSLGDGLMVAFASGVDALRCAVAMQRRIADHNLMRSGPVLNVRVGLHAGEPLRDGDDFHGSAVVVASRLCSEAEGGQILTSDLIAGLVGSRGGFRFRPAGRLRLKGLPEPLSAVTVEWRPPADAPDDRPVTRHPRRQPEPVKPKGPHLVGRERELTALEGELQRAMRGEFRCALVVGEPGVGKTRLAGELAARHATGVTALSARAYPLGATSAFGVWAEALERHLRGLEPRDVERLCAGCVDDLAGLLRSVRAVRGPGPVDEPPRSRLLEALTVVLSNLSAEQPVVVLLDDLHLADASSLEALHYLAYGCGGSRMLVVATVRPAELADRAEAAEVLARLEQDDLLRRFSVGPLGAEALGGLAEAVTGHGAEPVLVEWLEARSRGNPFYAIGLLRALLEEEADLSAPTLRRLPESLSERVTGRLQQLDDGALRTLELLAVLGRQVDSRSLVGLTGQGADELADILERLVNARFVAEEERGLELTYEIAHPLVAEAIYQGIGAGRRRRLHRQAGRGLLAVGRHGEAAPHFVRSAELGDDEAVVVLRDAVRQAEDAGSFREALTILASLVELLPAGDPRWSEVVGALSWEAQWVVDHRADSYAVFGIDALRAMDQALAGLPDVAQRASVKLRLANFLAWGTGQIDEAERVCREAHRLFEEAGDRRGALLATHELAWIDGLNGDIPAMEDAAREVYWQAAETADAVVQSRALRTIALTTMLRGRFEDADAAAEEVADNARAAGDPYRLVMVLFNIGYSNALQGRTEAAMAAVAEARTISAAASEGPVLPVYGIGVPWLVGDYPRVLAEARAHPPGAGDLSRRQAWGNAIAALAAAEMDELAEARRYLDRATAVYGDRPWGFYSGFAPYAAALLLWREGRAAEAALGLRAVVARWLDMEALGFALPALVDLAEVTARSGEPDPMAAAGLETIAGRTGLDCHRALAELGAAWASFGASDRGSAAASAAQAVEGLSGAAWPLHFGRAKCLLGLTTDDRDQAVDALRSAVSIFEQSGVRWRQREALDALDRLGSRGWRAAAAVRGPLSLTPRERAVAGLAASGLSAKEIGQRLFIGERTVEGHLARAYAKLGVGSKLELARRAGEFGLQPDA